MEKKENYEELYGKLVAYEEEIHRKNQKRIKIGLKCLFIIPPVFLVLLFLTGSSKTVFLILWIVSLFILAGYLIFIEYIDDKLQQKMNEISNGERNEREALIGENVEQMEEKLRTVIQNVEAAQKPEKGTMEEAEITAEKATEKMTEEPAQDEESTEKNAEEANQA